MAEVGAGTGASVKEPTSPSAAPAPKGVEVVDDPKRPGIRIFDDAAIMKAVNAQTALLPEGKPFAVVAFVDTDKTIRTAVTGRIGDDWSIVGKLAKPYHKPIEGEVMVVWTP